MTRRSDARLRRDKMRKVGSLPKEQFAVASEHVMRELRALRPGASDEDLVLWIGNMPDEERAKLGDFIIRRMGR